MNDFTIYEYPDCGGTVSVFRGRYVDECRVCGRRIDVFGHPIIWLPRICSDCCEWAEQWIPYVTATFDGSGEFCGNGPRGRDGRTEVEA